MSLNKPKLTFLSILLVISLAACGVTGTPQATNASPVPPQTPALIRQTSTDAPNNTATPVPADTSTAAPPTATAPQAATATAPSVPTQTAQPQPPVWVRNPNDKTLVKIDPATNTIQTKVTVEGGITVLQTTRTAIWAANRTTLYKLSPDDGQVVAKAELPYPAVTLAVGQSTIWVGMMVVPSNLQPGIDFSPSGKIAGINPDTLQIANTVDTRCSPKAIALNSTTVWVASGCFNLSVVDEIDQKTLKRTSISNDPNKPNDPALLPASVGGTLTMTTDAAWMVSADASTVYRIDPASHKITQQSDVLKNYNATPVGIVSAEGQVWLALTDGKVLGLDPAALSVLTQLDLGKQLSSVDFAFSQGAVWVNDPTNAVLTRIDPAGKKIVVSLSTGNSYATPTPMPTEAAAAACSITLPTRLKVGEQAKVDPQSSLPNQVRKAAGQNYGIAGQIQPGEIIDILEGPACADGWAWWKIKSEQTGLIG